MNLRIITSITVAVGLALSLSACEKKPSAPLDCTATDGSAIPCPTAGGTRTDPSGPVQQK